MTSQYLVYGAERESGRNAQMVIEADSAEDAETSANRLGLLVRSVEVYVPTQILESNRKAKVLQPDAVAIAPAASESEPRESVVWSGSPSQWTNFGTFLFAALFFWLLFIPPLIALYRYLLTRSTCITLTTERLRMEWGVLGKHLEEIELYRVRDTAVYESFIERIVGLGSIRIVTVDQTTPLVSIAAIREPRKVRELVRKHTKTMRRVHRVRDVDIS